MGKSKKDIILEQSYTIEEMQDEIDFIQENNRELGDVLVQKQARIGELIKENDRLTLTYEPYRPDNDPYANIEYFKLVDENDRLAAQSWEHRLEAAHYQQALKQANKRIPKYAGVLSFDFWPLRDWVRVSLNKWNPGRAFQFCLGPFRFDFMED